MRRCVPDPGSPRFRWAQSAWWLKPSQRCLWAENTREGETRLEEIHAARSTAAPRPSAHDPSLNVVFSSGWTYQGRARRAWTGGFKRPEPGMLVHAQFIADELSASSGSVGGGVRICNILRAVLIIVIENLFINKAQFTSLSINPIVLIIYRFTCNSLLYSRKKKFLS